MEGVSGGGAVLRTAGNSGPGKRVSSGMEEEVVFVFLRSGLSDAFLESTPSFLVGGSDGGGCGGGETESFFMSAIDFLKAFLEAKK